MADSKKHPNGELSLQEAADLLDVHYILAGPLRGAASPSATSAPTSTAGSFAEIVTRDAQTIAVGVAVAVAVDDLLRHRNRRVVSRRRSLQGDQRQLRPRRR
jgi:hypothetical protein